MLLISRCRYFCTARRRRGIIVPSYSHGYVLRILHSKAYLTAQSTLLFCIPQASMPGCDLNADVYGVYSVLSSRLSWSRGEMQNAKQCIQNNACARVPNSLRDIHNFIRTEQNNRERKEIYRPPFFWNRSGILGTGGGMRGSSLSSSSSSSSSISSKFSGCLRSYTVSHDQITR